MAQLFRGKVLCAQRRAHRRRELRLPDDLVETSGLDVLVDTLFATDWVVYAKPPFGGPDNVYACLGRYTHRVGLSNHRLRANVTFVGRNDKLVRLTHDRFIHRFLQHVLPPDFVRLRHYGLLAVCNATTLLEIARAHLGQPPPPPVDDLTWRALVSAHRVGPASLLALPLVLGRARRSLSTAATRARARRGSGLLMMAIEPLGALLTGYDPRLVLGLAASAHRLELDGAAGSGARAWSRRSVRCPSLARASVEAPVRASSWGMHPGVDPQDPHRAPRPVGTPSWAA